MDTAKFADPKVYNTIWGDVENYAKGHALKKRFWKVIQDVLNTTLREHFLPTPSELKLQIYIDDDNSLCAYQSLRKVPVDKDYDLLRQHHFRENRKGINAHCTCFAASGLSLQVAFQKVGCRIFDTVVEIFQGMFDTSKNTIPNLTNAAVLDEDCAYLRVDLLLWWMSPGADVLRTVMRQVWLLFTFGKENKKTEPLNIPTDTFKVVHQASLKHNFGKTNPTKVTTSLPPHTRPVPVEIFHETILASAKKCSGRKISPEEMPRPTGNFAPSPAAPTESTIITKNTPQFQIMPYSTTTTTKLLDRV